MLFCGTARAATYDLAGYPFTYNEASLFSGHITTNAVGTFTDPTAIEAIFTTSTFNATLFGSSSVLTSIDNSNSTWALEFDLYNSNPSVTLTIDESMMSLTFYTPAESSYGVLIARSNNGLSQLQYRQENNITDYNSVHFGFNAMHMAAQYPTYGTTFLFPVIAVPEPSSYLLFAFGLLVLAYAQRRHLRQTN